MNKTSNSECCWWNRLIQHKPGSFRNILLNTAYISFVELDFNSFLMIKICTYHLTLNYKYAWQFVTRKVTEWLGLTKLTANTVYSYVIYCMWLEYTEVYQIVTPFCDVVSWMLISELLRSKKRGAQMHNRSDIKSK